MSSRAARADYEAAHIPSAAFVDLGKDCPTRTRRCASPCPTAGTTRKRRCRPRACPTATTAWSTAAARRCGPRGCGGCCARWGSTAVLDGGLRQVARRGSRGGRRQRALSARPVCRPARPPRVGRQGRGARAIGNDAVCTINALSAAVHAGTAELNYGRKGHIKGSVNVPYASLLDADGCFKPSQALRPAFEAVGALGKPRVICYCGGGISATMDAMALHLHRPPGRRGVRRLDVGMGARRPSCRWKPALSWIGRRPAPISACARRRHRLHHPVEVEAARLLARRELVEALQPLADDRRRRRDQRTCAPCTSADSPCRLRARRARRGPCAGWSASARAAR